MTLAEHEAYLARPDMHADQFAALTAEILALNASPTPHDAIVRLVACLDDISDRQYQWLIQAISDDRRERAGGTAPPAADAHPKPLAGNWGRRILIAAVVLLRERCGPTEALARAGTLERVLVRAANRLRGVRE